jgi:phospholipase D
MLYAFLLGTFSGASYVEFDKRQWYSTSLDSGNINVCFTPPSGCAELIAAQIASAKRDLYIQAYSFTSKKIISQIIAAHQRGVKVKVLLDKSNLTDNFSKMSLLTTAGIKVFIDKAPGIAHNKVMIIDGAKVITGSFNFSNDADKRNVENVVLIKDGKIATTYLQNWHNRYNANIKSFTHPVSIP